MEPKYTNSDKSAWILIIFFLILLIVVHLTTCMGHVTSHTKYSICTSSGCDTVSSFKVIEGTGWVSYIVGQDTMLAYHPQIEKLK